MLLPYFIAGVDRNSVVDDAAVVEVALILRIDDNLFHDDPDLYVDSFLLGTDNGILVDGTGGSKALTWSLFVGSSFPDGPLGLGGVMAAGGGQGTMDKGGSVVGTYNGAALPVIIVRNTGAMVVDGLQAGRYRFAIDIIIIIVFCTHDENPIFPATATNIFKGRVNLLLLIR